MRSPDYLRLRSLRQSALFTAAVFATAVLFGATVAAQTKPASTRLAALEAEQAKAVAELSRVQADERRLSAAIAAKQTEYDSYIDPIQNPAGFVAGQTVKSTLQGQNTFDTGYATMVAKNELYNEIKALKAQLQSALKREAQLVPQIEARARTIAYNANPLAGDLANERERLRILKGQQGTDDDDGQLDRDRSNTAKRIRELEQQFQQPPGSGGSGEARTSSQGDPIPSSYTNPTGGTNNAVSPQTIFCWSDATQSWYPTNVPPCPPALTPPIYPQPRTGPLVQGLVAGGVVNVPPGPVTTNPGRQTPPNSGTGSGGKPSGGGAPGAPATPPTLAQGPTTPKAPAASGGVCDQPLCSRPDQGDCIKGVGPNDAGWIPACYANMLKRCNQGMAGGTGEWCVKKGADPSCEVRAQRVCSGK